MGFLLRCGADPTIVTYNARHETALHLAAAAAHAQCVTQLLRAIVYDGERHAVPLHLAINQQARDVFLRSTLRSPSFLLLAYELLWRLTASNFEYRL